MEKDLTQGANDDLLAEMYSKLMSMDPSTKEYGETMRSYTMLQKTMLENVEVSERLEFEKEKFESNTILETDKIQAQVKKDKAEKIAAYSKIGLGVMGLIGSIGMSCMVLKFNLDFGNEQGKDALHWVDKIFSGWMNKG